MYLGLYTECLKLFARRDAGSCRQLGLNALEIATGNWSRPAHIDLNLLLESAEARSVLLAKLKVEVCG